MPASIRAKSTFEMFETEILFTRAALKADPASQHLLSETDRWLEALDELRLATRDLQAKDVENSAKRAISNQNLDLASRRFGHDLVHEARGNPTRIKGFFTSAPSKWVRQPLDRQILMVRGWLSSEHEPVLEKHREALNTCMEQAEVARHESAALVPARSLNWQMRESFAAKLTEWRDALHRKLAEHGSSLGMPRTWANVFFRVNKKKPSKPKATVKSA